MERAVDAECAARAAEQLPDDRIAFLLAARGQAVEPEDQFFAALQCLPDFTMGINNTFTYKGVTLSFLIDIRHGGSLYSETVANLRSSGLAAETIAHREDASFIEPGVILQDDGTYRPNDVPVKSMQDYWQHISNSSNNEGNIYNASFVKLREVQLSYSFPRKWFKSFFVKSLDLGFEARNLWIIKDHVPHIDPEANFFGPSQIGGGVEFNSIPSTRSFGFNVRLTL